jgi:parallel beta-helix repeat protein
MNKGILSFLTVWLLVFSSLTGLFILIPVEEMRVLGDTIIVDDDGTPGVDCNYTSIQEGIVAANPGDTVFVKNGTYYENVVVNKVLSLVGENNVTTMIDGSENLDVVKIVADWVNLTGFSILNSEKDKVYSGVKLNNVDNCRIVDNNILYNYYSGIFLSGSNNNIVSNNNISGNDMFGMVIDDSTGNSIHNNSMENNGINIFGDNLEHWNTHHIDISNTVNGKPVQYWKNQTGGVVPLGAGQVILANCTNVTIENQELSSGSVGIELGFSSYNTVIHNNISYQTNGIYLFRAFINNINNNDLPMNNNIGIALRDSNDNNITYNNASNNKYGILLGNSDKNNVSCNNISDNDNGIYLHDTSKSNDVTGNYVFYNLKGIALYSIISNKVTNNTIFENTHGVYIYQFGTTGRNDIINNNISNNTRGIYIYFGSSQKISANNIFNNKYAIYIMQSSENNISDNNVSSNDYGIYLDDSDMNFISGNVMTNNGIFIWGDLLSHWNSHDIDISNSVDGKPIYYWKNQIGGIIPNDAGQVILANCVDVGVENLELTNSSAVIELGFSTNNMINDNIMSSNNQYGIYLYQSANNDIINNSILNKQHGIYIYESNGNNILGNNASTNDVAIYLEISNGNNIMRNNASYNDDGIYLKESIGNNISDNNAINNIDHGIYIYDSSNNNITNNNASHNENYGIFLERSSGIEVIGNNASNNDYGIYLKYSNQNNISDNRMIENGIFISGNLLIHWNSHNINTSNIVNNKPVYYWKDQMGGTIPNGAGQVILANCMNIIITNQILANSSVGIEIGFSSNNYIKSNNISSNLFGIYLYKSNENNISLNDANNNIEYGIYLSSSNENNISHNNISINTKDGIYLYISNNNEIADNYIFSNDYGISLFDTIGNKIYNNTLVENGIYINGIFLEYWNTHSINVSNTVNGKPLFYWKNQTGGTVPTDAGQVILANSSEIVIEDQELSHCSIGIQMGFSFNITIINNEISHNRYGIYLMYSYDSNITSNNITENYNGIFTEEWSYQNKIINNSIINNYDGIVLLDSNVYQISRNTIQSQNNIGIVVIGGGNVIYHNDFINNRYQAMDLFAINYWDNGYPSGGNYWSDYSGVDFYGGPSQNISGSDGFGDTSHTYNESMTWVSEEGFWIWGTSLIEDKYPLIEPNNLLENYITLKQGWNLISIPFIQEEQNLSVVLSSINGFYDSVEWYKISDTNDHWKHNRVDKIFGNDFFELNETMGFWIHITQPGGVIFLYNGIQPTENQTITLHPGWNLVGYPSQTSYNLTDGLNKLAFGTHVDSIWTYNASIQKWEELGQSDYFEIGRGYWIHAIEECTWEIPL